MQGVSITDIIVCSGECVNTPTSYHLYQQLRRLALHVLYASHTIVVVTGTLTPCLENSSIIPFGCLMFYQFCHLVYPFATASFRWRSTLLRVHPSLCRFVKAYCTLRVLRLVVLPLCRENVLAVAANGFTSLAYSTSTGSPVPPMRLSVSPGGFIPDVTNTSGNS